MKDNNNFIPRHGSPLFYPQDPSEGFQGGSGGLSRRKFLKRTGGATAATFLAWQGLCLEARADDEKKKESESKKTKDVPSEGYVYRISKQRQRKVRQVDGSIEYWLDEGVPDPPYLWVNINGNDGDSPPPPKPEAPAGFPNEVGWVEDVNEIRTKCRTEYSPAPGGSTSYTDEQNSGTNDGDGPPPAGYEWTSRIRMKVRKDKMPYVMKYRFSE